MGYAKQDSETINPNIQGCLEKGIVTNQTCRNYLDLYWAH
jgi:hypothetical protein